MLDSTQGSDAGTPIRVLIADDHEIVRAGMKQFIDDEPDMRVAAEAATGEEVIKLVQSEIFDVVLLDIAMPNKNGIDCLRTIRQFNQALPILIVSSYSETQYARSMLRLGANGYLAKGAPPDELIRAIRAVAGGQGYLSPDASGQVATASAGSADRPHETLSDREFQVFHKLAAGTKTNQIAKELNLSTKTVSTYRTRALGKLNLTTNADVTHYAMMNGLIE